MAESTDPGTNSLGLAFDQLNVSNEQQLPAASSADTATTSDDESGRQPKEREKKKPYIREAVAPRDKLSEQELSDRMARIREQNEKIKQRRLDVQADEVAFKQIQDAEKAQQARNRKIQDSVDKARQQNAERKMAAIQNRPWDSGKPQIDSTRGTRGRGRGRGGRGVHGGPRSPDTSREDHHPKPTVPAAATSTSSSVDSPQPDPPAVA